MLDLIRKAILHLFGLKQVIANQQARIAELTAINEQLRNANDLDSVSLRRAAEAAAADVRTAQAKNEALELQIAEINAAGVELAAAINDHPETPIVDETWSVLALSGVLEVIPRESLTEEQQEQADSVPAVATNQELSEGTFAHASDCAVHNEPAFPAGECDCREPAPGGSGDAPLPSNPYPSGGPGDYPVGLPPEKPIVEAPPAQAEDTLLKDEKVTAVEEIPATEAPTEVIEAPAETAKDTAAE